MGGVMEGLAQARLGYKASSGSSAERPQREGRPGLGAAWLCVLLLGSLLGTTSCVPIVVPVKLNPQWQVSRTVDPITDETRCVVASYDRRDLTSYSRVGYLYPVVEVHPNHGLLVGASSGGLVRVPVGDLVWRVDQNPHHEIKAADSPAGKVGGFMPDLGNYAISEEHRANLEKAQKQLESSLSGATLATGQQARALLEEMKTGSSLLFRNVVSDTGLPTHSLYQVGQYVGGKQEPIPLGEPFLEALADCGID